MDPRNRTLEVDAFLDGIEHPLKTEVQQLRLAILAAEPAITETIKWNAPNFRYEDEDRVTFQLQPRDSVQLIFHRGVRVRDDRDEFQFDDPTGLMAWRGSDRGILTLPAEEATTRQGAVTELVRRWVRT